jgi:hypothetical protein
MPTAPRHAAPALALTLILASVGVGGVAHAGEVRGTVIEYRLTQGDEIYKMMGEVKVPLIELEIRGTAKVYDAQVDLRWTVPDADPYLKLISACSGGRLSVVLDAEYDSGDKKIEGKGTIREMYCRTILR